MGFFVLNQTFGFKMGSKKDFFNHKLLQDLLKTDANQAIKILYEQHYAQLCLTVNRIVGDASTSEDIIQEIFLNLWRNRNDLIIKTSFRAYLKKAAINRALNYLRDHKKLSESWENVTPDKQTSLEKADQPLNQEEAEKSIAEAINALPPRCRTVFILSRYEELSHQEIADQLSITYKTVENQIGKALKQLRSQLKPYFDSLLSLLL